MKKVLCAILALVMCVAMAMPVFAAENEFVPSITYKDGPEIIEVNRDNDDITACVVLTSIMDAKNKSTDVRQSNRDLLLEVYEKLATGKMSLPLAKNYVIQELVDVDFKLNACINAGHSHEEDLNKENTVLSITFKTNISAMANMVIMQYKGGEWKNLETTNNGDGTFTCTFDDFCPVAFAVEKNTGNIPQTGDALGEQMGLWIGLMAASAAALVVVSVKRRRISG